MLEGGHVEAADADLAEDDAVGRLVRGVGEFQVLDGRDPRQGVIGLRLVARLHVGRRELQQRIDIDFAGLERGVLRLGDRRDGGEQHHGAGAEAGGEGGGQEQGGQLETHEGISPRGGPDGPERASSYAIAAKSGTAEPPAMRNPSH